MNGLLKTKICVICGKEAVAWRGNVTAYRRMALGNMMPLGVAAGRCEEHVETETPPHTGLWRVEYGIADTDLFGMPIQHERIFAKG